MANCYKRSPRDHICLEGGILEVNAIVVGEHAAPLSSHLTPSNWFGTRSEAQKSILIQMDLNHFISGYAKNEFQRDVGKTSGRPSQRLVLVQRNAWLMVERCEID